LTSGANFIACHGENGLGGFLNWPGYLIRPLLNQSKEPFSLGFAHRDLKLENVVMNEQGIMKIINSGSAIVLKHSSTNGVILATGEKFFHVSSVAY
jgi:serine/threonine protein kinase